MSERHANALVHPPILYLGGLVTGSLLEVLMPIGPGLAGGSARAVWAGLAIAAVGFAIAVKAMKLFADAGTSLPVHTPTDALVTEGLYSWSRNPIYISLSVFYVGLSIALTTGWALLLLPFVIVILQKGVIEREEAYLAEEFGEAYLAYRNRVPRWL